jgi:hypothetical protein
LAFGVVNDAFSNNYPPHNINNNHREDQEEQDEEGDGEGTEEEKEEDEKEDEEEEDEKKRESTTSLWNVTSPSHPMCPGQLTSCNATCRRVDILDQLTPCDLRVLVHSEDELTQAGPKFNMKGKVSRENVLKNVPSVDGDQNDRQVFF